MMWAENLLSKFAFFPTIMKSVFLKSVFFTINLNKLKLKLPQSPLLLAITMPKFFLSTLSSEKPIRGERDGSILGLTARIIFSISS
ncbi:MAG: hypothetical protein ACD_12C00816G0001 [uncultured bacterium]|nr:MAG: hypothetical protein ACD_12C00816G0001 [uncultured bacterium]